MKILFVYSLDDIQSTSKPLRSWATIQFGISYISSVLKAHGHHTALLVLGSNKLEESRGLLQAFIRDSNPDLICFTAVFSQYHFVEKTAKFIKDRWADKYLLIGGVHATSNPEEVINGPFDALCIGEGEYPTLELCSQLQAKKTPRGIANLWVKDRDGNIEKNKTRDFIQDLDALPFPDRDMWRPWMKEQADSEFAVLLGRGCPYNCTYCSNHVLRKIAGGQYTRFRSPENILKEINFLYKNYPVRKIYLEVETITANKTWAMELCDKLESFNATVDNSISYGCNFRITRQPPDERLFASFKKANFYKINIGLESGSERVRRDILKRDYSNKDFMNVIAMARRYGLSIYVFNMIGLPGESLGDHMETVLLNRQCQPEGHYTGIFFPYPGTELYDICVKQDLLKSADNAPMERRQPIISLPNFSKAQIQHAYTWFHYRVYKGYKPRWVILTQTIVTKVKSNPATNFLFRQAVQLPILHYLRAKLAKK